MPEATGGQRRTLVVMRHATAESAPTLADIDRPLAVTGRTQAATVAAALQSESLLPQVVLCSNAVRTRMTWQLIAAKLPPADVEQIAVHYVDELYGAGPRQVLQTVAHTDPAVTRLMVVAHEPTVSSLCALVAGPDSDAAAVAQARTGFPTATFGVVETTRPWLELTANSATLTAVHRPH